MLTAFVGNKKLAVLLPEMTFLLLLAK